VSYSKERLRYTAISSRRRSMYLVPKKSCAWLGHPRTRPLQMNTATTSLLLARQALSLSSKPTHSVRPPAVAEVIGKCCHSQHSSPNTDVEYTWSGATIDDIGPSPPQRSSRGSQAGSLRCRWCVYVTLPGSCNDQYLIVGSTHHVQHECVPNKQPDRS
jgi:hypothetical protein